MDLPASAAPVTLYKQSRPHPREDLQEALCLAAQEKRLGPGNLSDSLKAPQGLFRHGGIHPMAGVRDSPRPLCTGPTWVELAQAQRYVWTEPELTLMHTSPCK